MFLGGGGGWVLNIIICTNYIPFDSLFWYVLTKRPHLFTERPLKQFVLLLSVASGTVVLDLDRVAEAKNPDFSKARGSQIYAISYAPPPFHSITKLLAIFSMSLKPDGE